MTSKKSPPPKVGRAVDALFSKEAPKPKPKVEPGDAFKPAPKVEPGDAFRQPQKPKT